MNHVEKHIKIHESYEKMIHESFEKSRENSEMFYVNK